MDELLVKKAKRGNKKAFTSIIESVKVDGYKLAYSYLRKDTDSKDALCNAIEKAFINIKKYTLWCRI